MAQYGACSPRLILHFGAPYPEYLESPPWTTRSRSGRSRSQSVGKNSAVNSAVNPAVKNQHQNGQGCGDEQQKSIAHSSVLAHLFSPHAKFPDLLLLVAVPGLESFNQCGFGGRGRHWRRIFDSCCRGIVLQYG